MPKQEFHMARLLLIF
ncbi:UNVERIFIED_CONTAM: hypothetical protein GTU68_041638 [Idotea baltica]|nr:hypothetical protein [Idotea baltica]